MVLTGASGGRILLGMHTLPKGESVLVAAAISGVLLFASGCGVASGEFEPTQYQQRLDSELQSRGSDHVEVFVRLHAASSASAVHALLAATGSPEVTSITASVSVPSGSIQVGTTPFSGEVTDDAVRAAIADYALTRHGSQTSAQIVDAIAAGTSFDILTLTGLGRADEMREWWHLNAGTVDAVVVEGD